MSKLSYEFDGDQVVLQLQGTQRVRNILTLEERVQAIKAYDAWPVYTKVAKMFSCSWEQIKNIVASRDAIMEFYEATRNANKIDDPDRDEIRKRKLAFLGECMYEYIQRAQFHRRTDLNEDLLRTKAHEFRDLIQIDKFMPNKSWINHFKATYNISLSNRQITLTRIPPDSLDLKDIMTYCGKNKPQNNEIITVQGTEKSGQTGRKPTPTQTTPDHERSSSSLYRTKTRVEVSQANQATLEMVEQRRKRKINFMERALYEYLQRATFHQKIPANYDRIRDVAIQLLNILKIEGFFPNRNWLKHFKNRFNFSLSQGVLVKDRTPPLSLDLRDILSYCSRNDRDQPPATVTLTPKENAAIAALHEKRNKKVLKAAAATATKSNNNNNSVIETNYHSDDDDVIVVERKQELIVIKDDDDFESDTENGIVVVNNAAADADVATDASDDDECSQPPLKIRKVETITPFINDTTLSTQSPGHWSEHSVENDSEEPLPKTIRNYEDALRLIRPLEEFAMLEENFRVIGLLSQLEEIFKNQPKKNCDNSEDNDSNL